MTPATLPIIQGDYYLTYTPHSGMFVVQAQTLCAYRIAESLHRVSESCQYRTDWTEVFDDYLQIVDFLNSEVFELTDEEMLGIVALTI
jgi:hypothetical protein